MASQEEVKIVIDFILAKGQYDFEKKIITLHPFYAENPMILLHEMGHYIAIKKRNDFSEKAANIEAKKLAELVWDERTRWLFPLWSFLGHYFLVKEWYYY